MNEEMAGSRYESSHLLCKSPTTGAAFCLGTVIVAIVCVFLDIPPWARFFAAVMIPLFLLNVLIFLLLTIFNPSMNLLIEDGEIQYLGPIKKIRFRFGDVRRTILSADAEADNWARLSFELRNGDSLSLAPQFVHENNFELLKFLSRQGMQLDPESGGERFLRKAGLSA